MFPKENTVLIPITEEESLMYKFIVVEKDECNYMDDQIKINAVSRVKNKEIDVN